MRRVIYTVLTVAILASCAPKAVEKKEKESKQPEAVSTKGVAAVAAVVELTEEFTSEIEAYRENDITPAASGVRIDRILFDVGDRVAEGEIVATLDPTMYDQQMISVSTLRADYERLLPVFEAGGISRQTLDQAKSAYDIQQEIAANIKKNIELRSPISGVVTERSAEAGDLFSNQPIMHIAQIDKVKVLVNISEQYFPNVKVGMPVELSLDIYPDEKFSGKVSLIYPKLDAASRTFKVEVTAPNTAMKMRPGMFAHTTFMMGSKEGVLVSDVAIQKQFGSAENFVYVDNDGVAERRRVVLGRQVDDLVDVISGVEVGEVVLTTAFSRLSDGAAIELK